MKRFFKKILIFGLLTVIIDICYGLVGTYFYGNIRNGMTGMDNIAATEMIAPILVFGSSRARRHYDTRIIADSLKQPCFNCGYNAQGINFNLFRLKQILARYSPEIIIYDITPHYDMLCEETTEHSFDSFKPYFYDSDVYSYMREESFKEWIKCHSSFYRYHDLLDKGVTDYNSKEKIYNGYAPYFGSYNVKKKVHEKKSTDPLKLNKLEEFMILCKKHSIKLYFALSPYYMNDMGDLSSVIAPLAKAYEIPVFDFFNDSTYINDSNLFWDSSHMNSKGAEKYTKQIVSAINCSEI